jgi:hypothetical protein
MANILEFARQNPQGRFGWDYAAKPLLIPKYDPTKELNELSLDAPTQDNVIKTSRLAGGSYMHEMQKTVDETKFKPMVYKQYDRLPKYTQAEISRDEYYSRALYGAQQKNKDRVFVRTPWVNPENSKTTTVEPTIVNGNEEWNLGTQNIVINRGFNEMYDPTTGKPLPKDTAPKNGHIGRVITRDLNNGLGKQKYTELTITKTGANTKSPKEIQAGYEEVYGKRTLDAKNKPLWNGKPNETAEALLTQAQSENNKKAAGGGTDQAEYGTVLVPYSDVQEEIANRKIILKQAATGKSAPATKKQHQANPYQ